METTRSERIKLGAFMLLCGILICVFLGYVLKRYLSEQYDNYYTIFDTSVNGLFVDAKVKLNGIDVGSVTRITINEENLNEVVVNFKVTHGTPIKIGTRAGMTAGMNLTGEKQVVLSGGSFSEPNVPEGGLVPAEVSHFDHITSQAGNIVAHVDSVLVNVNTLLSAENAENLSKAIKNFEAMTANLSRVTQGMAKPIENISKSAESMHRVMGEIEEAKIAAKAGEDLDILKQKLDAIDTKAMNENLTKAMESISQLSKRLDGMVYKNQDQVGDAIVELNAVLENLEEFSQKIKNNPSALIREPAKTRRK
ncbi:phospholipid/cholesterol/gamma-HCH transport system substrate-binding protein [Fibrobacter sp. UWCM]|uniref:MlaD family protein n=1 Tax=Fibrobacter sp. UWCM TaxID=1896208 RepID=UPI00091A758E|nr:MlaD family protein [Fibrobacter sp. UWCM]SHH12802.1 phospholipid/cholesterol/gamma-HCH transport system substrate-binding protein [Fibrobacter sp. UWCM]